MFRLASRALCLLLLPLAASYAQAAAPGFGYATDDANRIVSVNLLDGATTVYSGNTVFGANALGYSDNNGAQGSVIYASSASSGATVGELAVWDRATNTHTDIGNLFGTYNGAASPIPAGTSISDAAYWGGATGPAAGYYIVAANHNIYRVSFSVSGVNNQINAISGITLAGTIPKSTVTKNFSFGDIAFNPADGTMYLSDSANGFSSYSFASGTAASISSRYNGQIAFGQDGNLYGVGNSSGTASTQGNDLYQISLTTGAVTILATNTNPGRYYTDFSGAATLNIVPEPGTVTTVGLAVALAAGAAWRRRRV